MESLSENLKEKKIRRKKKKKKVPALLEAGVTVRLDTPQRVLSMIPLNITGEIKFVQNTVCLRDSQFW